MLPRTLLLATLMALAACMKTAAMPSLTLCAPLRFGNASDDDARTLAAVASWMQLGDTPPAVLLFADDDGSACAAFEAAIGGMGGGLGLQVGMVVVPGQRAAARRRRPRVAGASSSLGVVMAKWSPGVAAARGRTGGGPPLPPQPLHLAA